MSDYTAAICCYCNQAEWVQCGCSWSDCSKHLPKPNVAVLVVVHGRVENTTMIWNEVPSPGWKRFDGGFVYGQPTHWMPLPRKPGWVDSADRGKP